MEQPVRQFYDFGPFRLDVADRRLLRDGRPVPLRAKLFDTLLHLVQHAGRLVEKDDLIKALWPDAVVEEANLAHNISQLRKAMGEGATGQHYLETMPKRGYRFAAKVREVTEEWPATPNRLAVRQEIRFCTARDGVRIAYATAGQGPPLVKTANWLNHLEFDWESPIWRHLLEELASEHLLVRYDERGNGLSDWRVDDFSFDAFVRDLEAVVDSLGLKRFALFGISQGGAVAIAYAVRYPERVSHLVLQGAYAVGWARRATAEELERRRALVTLAGLGWGQDNPAYRQLFTMLYVPDATPAQAQWFNDLQRRTTSPENAVRLMETFADIDVRELLPRVSVPTLVFHCRDESVVPFEAGRRLAAEIPGARLVELPGRNHLLLEHEPAWGKFLAEVGAFLRTPVVAR